MRMGNFLSKTAIMSILAAACLSTTAMAADVIGTGMVEGDSLRVRSEASTTASIVTYLSDKTQVQVHEDLGEWYKVSWGSYTGFVSAIRPPQPRPPAMLPPLRRPRRRGMPVPSPAQA